MPVNDDLGTRMKLFYEQIPKTRLMRRCPVLIRIDGKAFHTFTKGFKRPFDAIGFASETDVGSLLRMFKGTKSENVSDIKDPDERKICESENLAIPKLKKRIKYCDNPLEKKQLQRELNYVYKKRAVNSRGGL